MPAPQHGDKGDARNAADVKGWETAPTQALLVFASRARQLVVIVVHGATAGHPTHALARRAQGSSLQKVSIDSAWPVVMGLTNGTGTNDCN